ncbi:hypothetical protein FG386_002543 [Cryptosporidium ryanae]|uniref:uncharacterized protein n=1 Tax=Cryptosporidium ryanae TaxID=515981 RepID=UPI00351A8F6A|nr:hypothetical protein FG386_002543 [Cryptosporidium ryanae]
MVNKSISGSNIDIKSQKIINNSESRMKNIRSIINLNFEVDKTSKRDFLSKEITIFPLYMYRITSLVSITNLAKIKLLIHVFLEECISNYLSERAGGLVIDYLMDIPLSEKMYRRILLIKI